LRSSGCFQIGWALPASAPPSANLGVGDDNHSWACDGLRGMKWHGSMAPWRWKQGDVMGCAVDLCAGNMSF
ncbi:unnamed protein product, partial [Discosporangium mesarthrocarpum]